MANANLAKEAFLEKLILCKQAKMGQLHPFIFEASEDPFYPYVFSLHSKRRYLRISATIDVVFNSDKQFEQPDAKHLERMLLLTFTRWEQPSMKMGPLLLAFQFIEVVELHWPQGNSGRAFELKAKFTFVEPCIKLKEMEAAPISSKISNEQLGLVLSHGIAIPLAVCVSEGLLELEGVGFQSVAITSIERNAQIDQRTLSRMKEQSERVRDFLCDVDATRTFDQFLNAKPAS